jgi:hypothetical protein
VTTKLKCIRMSRAALEAVSDLKTIMTFYSQPVDPTTNRKVAVTFDTPTHSYWAVGPAVKYWNKCDVVGVERRMDGRWCWVIETP